MKKLNAIILMIFITTISFAQNSIEADKSQIKKLITESFDDILSDFNAKNIDKYYTKDFLLLENGEVWNNDSIINYLDNAVLQNPMPSRANSFEFIEIKISKGMAWVAYKNQAIISIDNEIIREVNWLESATAILTENGWRLQLLHSTPIENEY